MSKKIFSVNHSAIGKVKYSLNIYDGKKHKDGSPFIGIDTAKSKQEFARLITKYKTNGYTEVNDVYKALHENTITNTELKQMIREETQNILNEYPTNEHTLGWNLRDNLVKIVTKHFPGSDITIHYNQMTPILTGELALGQSRHWKDGLSINSAGTWHFFVEDFDLLKSDSDKLKFIHHPGYYQTAGSTVWNTAGKDKTFKASPAQIIKFVDRYCGEYKRVLASNTFPKDMAWVTKYI